MKVINRISLVIFSIIILALSLVTAFVITGWLEIDLISNFAMEVFSNKVTGSISLGLAILFSILAVKCIFFSSNSKEKSKEGILLENENGKLLVSKDTIESITQTVIKNFESVENATTRIDVDSENKIGIFITLSVYSEAIIKDLAAKIQSDVKTAVKNSLDLEIKEVNVRIKNVTTKKENIVKE